MGLHGHTFFELLLIERGQGSHRVGRVTHRALPGSLFIVPPGELHDCAALGEAEGWVLLFAHEAITGHAASLAFSRSWMPQHPLFFPFLALGSGRLEPFELSPSDLACWSRRIGSIVTESVERRPGYQYGVHAHLSLVLLDLLRLSGPPASIVLAGDDPLLDSVFGFIERSYHRPISLRDVAQAVGRSPAHLTTTLRQRTGLTGLEWITERRMAEARRLLVQTDLDLDAIAARTGYSEPDGLIRGFKRLHRLTPSAWRRAHRGGPAYVFDIKTPPDLG